MARKGALLGCNAAFDTHCERSRAGHSMALALLKRIFSCLHLPFLSSGLWDAEQLHLSQRAWLRAVKGCYQPQGSVSLLPVQLAGYFPEPVAGTGLAQPLLCWNCLPFLCTARLGSKANLGRTQNGDDPRSAQTLVSGERVGRCIVQGVPMSSHTLGWQGGPCRSRAVRDARGPWREEGLTASDPCSGHPAFCSKDKRRLIPLFPPAITHWLVATQLEEHDLSTGWLSVWYGAAQEAFHHQRLFVWKASHCLKLSQERWRLSQV